MKRILYLCNSGWVFGDWTSISTGATRRLKVSGSREIAGWSSISMIRDE